MSDEINEPGLNDYRLMFGVALSELGNWHDAEDIAGDGLVRIYEKDYDSISGVHRDNLVRKISRNLVRDKKRRGKIISFERLPDEAVNLNDDIHGYAKLAALADNRMDPAIQVDQQVKMEIILEVFERLTPQDRQTLRAVLTNRPHKELELAWCLGPSGVTERIKRAQLRFTKLLEEQGIYPPKVGKRRRTNASTDMDST